MSSSPFSYNDGHDDKVRTRPVNKKIIVGISGASGSCYGISLLKALKALHVESHLILSRAARVTLTQESSLSISEIEALASYNYNVDNIGALLASGSYKTSGMIIAPCSIKTASEIAHGITSNLLTRAADVCLKERRPLILMIRETPLHSGHLRTMLTLSEIGAIIAPPMPAFYAKPQTLDDMVDYTITRLLDLLGFELDSTGRWQGL